MNVFELTKRLARGDREPSRLSGETLNGDKELVEVMSEERTGRRTARF